MRSESTIWLKNFSLHLENAGSSSQSIFNLVFSQFSIFNLRKIPIPLKLKFEPEAEWLLSV